MSAATSLTGTLRLLAGTGEIRGKTLTGNTFEITSEATMTTFK
jgi:hypothetical protein